MPRVAIHRIYDFCQKCYKQLKLRPFDDNEVRRDYDVQHQPGYDRAMTRCHKCNAVLGAEDNKEGPCHSSKTLQT